MKFLKHIFYWLFFLDFRSLWSWLSSVSPQGELDALYLVSIRHWFLSSLSTPTFSYTPKANKQGSERLLETIGPAVSGQDLWPVWSTFLPFYYYSLLNRHEVISVCDRIELLGKQSLNFSSWVLLFIIRLKYVCRELGASLVAWTVKNLPTMLETRVWFLGWEDTLEKGMATPSSILAWRIP